MALTDSFPTEDGGGLSITDTRLILAGLVARNAAGTPRLGILPWHTNPIVAGTTGMSFSVGPFVAATSRNGAGVELVANDAATTVATTAAPGSNSRIDVIWVRCRFPVYSDAGQTTPLFGVTQGTASGSPVKPAIPAGALELATAVITSSTTRTDTGVVITQTAPFTAAAGGIVKVRNSTELASWSPADGAVAHRLDNGVDYDRVGGAWVGRRQLSTVAIGTFGANWSATVGYTPTVVVDGPWRVLEGAVTRAGGGALTHLLTIPSGHRPPSNRFLGAHITSGAERYELFLEPTGILKIDEQYASASLAGVYPLGGMWRVA